MPKVRHPHRGSMQYWPRKRSRHSLARVRSWPIQAKAKVVGFIGYKAGMTHLQLVDNRPKSMTKGEVISFPATIIECPPMKVAGISFYKNKKKSTVILTEKLDQHLARNFNLPKKLNHKLEQITDFDDLRLLVHSQPKLLGIGVSKPKMIEVGLGGNKNEKLVYAKEILGKEIQVKDVFEGINAVDVHGTSKGKGFQGTVKRFGVPIRQHKAEKTKRGIATLGSWHPNRILFTVAQPGKMGYHSRTEFNKQILKIGQEGQDVTPAGGIIKYGVVSNSYLLLKGSVLGPPKRAVLLTLPIRPNYKIPKEAPEITVISK